VGADLLGCFAVVVALVGGVVVALGVGLSGEPAVAVVVGSGLSAGFVTMGGVVTVEGGAATGVGVGCSVGAAVATLGFSGVFSAIVGVGLSS
jgi:hypothetical protein